MKKRVFLCLLVGLLAVGLLISGCANSSAGNKGTIAVIVKSTQHEFWQAVKKGAEDAGKKEGYEVQFKGASTETAVGEQVNIVEDAINQQVSSIVLAASDTQALVPSIQRATQSGIPVITIDSGVKSDLPKSHVATDNRAAAGIAAEKMAQLIHQEGKVAIVNFVAGAASAVDREEGFKSVISKYPNIHIINTFYSDGDQDKAYSIALDILNSNPDIKGIFCANEGAAVGVAKAIKSAGKAGKVTVIGFDSSKDEISFIKNGVMNGTVVQNPYQIGYQGVELAVKVINKKPVEKRIDTGATYVDKNNINNPEIEKLVNPLGK
jgi:ribose transport system substrate-binding protein